MTLFIDASATIAIIAGEADAAQLAHAMGADPDLIGSPISRWETIVGLHRSHGFSLKVAQENFDDFARKCRLRLIEIGEVETQLALSAYDRYGKNRHRAALNMGDCFAYACAKANDARLLYKGNDFAQTDLA